MSAKSRMPTSQTRQENLPETLQLTVDPSNEMNECKQSSDGNMYRHYVLFMLSLTYAFSFMDRQIVSILLGDLKAEFGLNDTQLGLMSGLAFAVLYTTLAIPIARYADRHNRMNVISLAVALWSLFTACSACVANFSQLLLARVGVGIGEAGGLSPAHSVISDYFDDNERSLALSLFSLGAALGAMMGMAMGGWIAQKYGWRAAFLVAGLPGIGLAALVKFTVKEPPRGQLEKLPANSDQEPFRIAVQSLAFNLIYRKVLIGHTLVVFTGYAMASWLPQVMLRNYEVTQAEVGSIIGLTYGLGVATGMLAGGMLASHFSKQNKRWQLRIPIIGLMVAMPIYWFALNAETFYQAAVFFGLGLFFFNMQHGPSLAVIQTAVKPDQRATAAALNFFFANLFGLAMGPLLVGWTSDLAAPRYGDASISIALGLAILVSLPGIYFFYRASNHLG